MSVTTEPRITRMLDLSTAHLPRHLGDSSYGSLAQVPGVVAYEFSHGFLMWVPDDPHESAEVDADALNDPEFTDVVLPIQLFARSLGCDYVMFDCDAERVAELPAWEW